MKKILLLSLLLLLPPLMYAQSAKFPIVSGFGGIYEIPDAVYPDAEMEYSIVIDLKSPQPDKSEINAGLNNVARMMNLHVLGGVAPEKLQVKVLIHGEATYLITNDEAYKERFGTINPNTPLISALVNAGAELYV